MIERAWSHKALLHHEGKFNTKIAERFDEFQFRPNPGCRVIWVFRKRLVTCSYRIKFLLSTFIIPSLITAIVVNLRIIHGVQRLCTHLVRVFLNDNQTGFLTYKRHGFVQGWEGVVNLSI